MDEKEVQESIEPDAGGAELDTGGVTDDAGGVTDPLFSEGEFTWKYDGGEHVIKDRRQLADAFRHSYMNRETLDQERRKIEDQRRSMDEALQTAKTSEQSNSAMFARYRSWDDQLKQNPQLYREMERLVDEYQSGGKVSDEIKTVLEAELKPIKSELSEYKKAKEAQKEEEEFAAAAEQLKSEYEDFDATSSRAFLSALREVPEADVKRKLLEMAYHAQLGQQRMADLESRSQQAPGLPSLVSTPGKKTNEPDVSKMDENEKEAYAASLLAAMK